MVIFAAFDMVVEKGDTPSFGHESSVSSQIDNSDISILSSGSPESDQQCPDHCPDCHDCHFGHCGMISDSSVITNGEFLNSEHSNIDEIVKSRDFHSVFRPPIKT